MKTIQAINIRPRDYVRNGVKHVSDLDSNHTFNAEIAPRESIRIWGIMRSMRSGDTPFDRTFKLGDACVYHSYNLVYTGTIVAIGAKTITVRDDSETVRLDLHAFCRKNWDFDADRIRKQNKEMSNII